MLKEILNLLKERGPMSLAELTLALGSETAAVEGMLQTLERKGRIERIAGGSKCASCKGCALVDPAQASIFKAV
jgi:putative ferrous iron transport protein C